jgi:hypothetical protein
MGSGVGTAARFGAAALFSSRQAACPHACGEVSDTCSAEKQMTRSLPKLARAEAQAVEEAVAAE